MGALAKYSMAFDIPESWKDATVLKLQDMVGNHYKLQAFTLYEVKADGVKFTDANKKGVNLLFTDMGGAKFRCATHGVAIVELCENIIRSGDDIAGTEFTVATRKSKSNRTVYVLD